MKLIHLSDLHFGKIVNEFNMFEDQRYIMTQILDIIDKERPDALLLAGDIYDRNIPPAAAVDLLDEFLWKVTRLEIPIFLISGNHDSAERLNFLSRLLTARELYIVTTVKHTIPKVILSDTYGEVHFYLLPFIRPSQIAVQFSEEKIVTTADAVGMLLDHTEIDPQQRNVLMTHFFVTAANQLPELSDSENPASVGGIDAVDVSCFEAFDYVALGHLHKPQRVGRETVRYGGSPLKYSFSEAGHHKYVTVVELKGKDNVEIRQCPLKPLHDLRKIRGELHRLIQPEIYTQADPQDYLHVTLTDELALIDPMHTLRSVYPNVMQLAFEHRDQQGSTLDALEALPLEDEQRLFERFYTEVTGEVLDEKRRQLMEEVIDEARKINH